MSALAEYRVQQEQVAALAPRLATIGSSLTGLSPGDLRSLAGAAATFGEFSRAVSELAGIFDDAVTELSEEIGNDAEQLTNCMATYQAVDALLTQAANTARATVESVSTAIDVAVDSVTDAGSYLAESASDAGSFLLDAVGLGSGR